ncbi:iron ABC transporter permease [Chitinimonas taiwanensis]|uniref:iron ABC transporter permease n=1 Tax=Chitinimonas taiwanensis TaxID=240412 RepID=UPI0035B4F824
MRVSLRPTPQQLPLWLLAGLGLALAWSLLGPLPASRATVLSWLSGRIDTDTFVIALQQLRLPRLTATLLAGAALGMAGCLLQALSRNPLASPSVLGVTAGAQIGLIVAVLLPPSLALAAVPAVFGGALLAVTLCFVVAGGWRAHPLTLVLAGTVVSLLLSAVVSLLMVLFDQNVAGVALWSAGSLFQPGWRGVQASLPWFALAVFLAWRGRQALQLLALGDDAAASVGLDVARFRRRLLLIATLLSAVAVTLAGPIALVGLIAPNLLRLLGLHKPSRLLPAAGLAGALILALADPAADWLADTSRSLLPLGVATALAGTPLLLWLIARQGHRQLPAQVGEALGRRRSLPLLYGLLVLALLLIAALGLRLSPQDWLSAWREPSGLAALLFDLRAPRIAVAMLAGALLAAAGVLLQGVVRNPLAGPELMGLSQGAALAVLLALAVFDQPALLVRLLFALGGAAAVLGALLWISRRHDWEPMQLALAGMGLATLGGALGTLVVAQAKLQVASAVTWLAGSSYGRGWADAALLLAGMLILLPLALRLARGLDILGLGDESAASLGLAVRPTRFGALALATLFTAVAVAAAGPVGFVGLVAPHFARLLGAGRHKPRLWLAVLLGALICALADLLARTLLAPRDLPFGIITAFIGAPYFLWLLARSRKLA